MRILKLPERPLVITLPVSATTRLELLYDLIKDKNVIVDTEHNIVSFDFSKEKDLFDQAQKTLIGN